MYFTNSLLRVHVYFAVSPLESSFLFTTGSMAGWRRQGRRRRPFPVRARAVSGEGPGVEENVGVESYLLVPRIGAGVAPWWWRHASRRPAAVLPAAAAPVRQGGGDRA
jgi:hypothetical protein